MLSRVLGLNRNKVFIFSRICSRPLSSLSIKRGWSIMPDTKKKISEHYASALALPLIPSYRQMHLSRILFKEQIVSTPPFADSVAEGDVKWLKAVGDSAKVDEAVCEIETDKTSILVPAPGNGKIVERYVEEGATVNPDQKLFKIKLD